MRLSIAEYKSLNGCQSQKSKAKKLGNDPSFKLTMESLLTSHISVKEQGDGRVFMMQGVLMPSLNKVLRWHPIKEYYAYNMAMRAQIQAAVTASKVVALSDELGYVLIVRSGRTRLLDVDNIPPKFIVDGIIHAGILPDDNPRHIAAEVILPQEKVRKGDEYVRVDLVPKQRLLAQIDI